MVTSAASNRRDIDDDSAPIGSGDSRSTDDIMATIRDILTRDGSHDSFDSDGSPDSIDYPSSSSNSNDESLLLEMEAQLRTEVDHELSSLPTPPPSSPPTPSISVGSAPMTSSTAPTPSVTSPTPLRSSPTPTPTPSSSSLSDYIPSPPRSMGNMGKIRGTTLLSEVSHSVTPESVASVLLSEHSGEIRTYLERSLEPIARRWLSDHLPTLADNVVRSEIERLARSRP